MTGKSTAEDELTELRSKVAALEARLAERRKYGLVWAEPTGDEDDPYETEQVRDRAARELPLLKEDEGMAIGASPSPHLLVEGDNYFTLLGLTFTHQRAIDLIYIDPPYNTGKADDFRYNDKFVAGDDAFRHSKWLSFMAPRLEMASELLTDEGVILISIDDNEFATLKLLCDEIFTSGNFIGTFIWDGGRRNDAKFVSSGHDYILAYARNRQTLEGLGRRWMEEKPALGRAQALADRLINEGGSAAELTAAWRSALKSLPEGDELKSLGQTYAFLDEQGPFASAPLVSPNPRPNLIYDWKGYKTPKNGWRVNQKGMKELDEADRLIYPSKKSGAIRKKRYLDESPDQVLRSVFYSNRVASGEALKRLMGEQTFKYPKDPVVLARLFRAILGHRPDAVILDFFAGSGSTGQAVLEMNVEDGTNHQFILGTNDENGISREVAHERLRRLMTGKCADGTPRPDGGDALGGSLRFFVSDKEFVTRSDTPDQMRAAFRTACRDLIRLKENCFEPTTKGPQFEIFTGETKEGQPHVMAILYGLQGREKLIKELEKQPEAASITVYAFSLNSQADPRPFRTAFGDRLRLGNIPEQLLRTYERSFERRLYGGWSA